MTEPLRVLIVEDSEDDAELLLLELRRSEFGPITHLRVDTAEEMSAALDNHDWDIVVSDHRMPRFSALAALELLKSRREDLPFIIVSGAIGEETAVEAMRAGAHDYLLKDNLARLAPAIRRELREAEERRKRREAEQGLERYHQRLQILHEIDRAILAARSPEEIGESVLDRLCSLLSCKGASILIFEDDESDAVFLAGAGVARRGGFAIGDAIERARLDNLDTFAEGNVEWTSDVTTLQRVPNVVSLFCDEDITSYVVAPIVADEKLIGLLMLCSDNPENFSTDHVQVSREIADQLAVVLRQARLHEQVRRHAVELEQRVAERTRELREANESLEAFTNSVSHDLRAPLRAMVGYAEALREDYDAKLDDQGRTYLVGISDSALRMDTLIRDLLTYSQISHARVQLWPVRLAGVIEEALNRLDREIHERDAVITIREPLPRITGDHSLLLGVVTSLLSNAVTYVPRGRRPEIEIWAESNEDVSRLYVEDNGLGIPEEHQERIFRIFERLQNSEEYPGNGIGLAVVRKSMERMNGRSGVQSVEGKGSRFWVEWPKKRPRT